MSRHRNVRTIDVDEEYDGYYSCYGHSVEDEFCISPQTESQFLYDRNSQSRSAGLYFTSPEPVPEEDICEDESYYGYESNVSNLSYIDKAKLESCVEAMQDVVGDSIPEYVLKEAALDNDFNLEKSLDAVLKENAPKSKRTKNFDPLSDPATSIASGKTVNTVNLPDDSRKAGKTKAAADGPQKSHVSLVKNEVPVSTTSIPSVKNEINISSPSLPSEKASSEEPKVNTRSKKSEQDVAEVYMKERGQEKSLLNLVVIGHVDAGKSTLMGHLLYRLGQVSKRTMHKFEQDSKKLGKSSFMYAWVLDETPEERNRGITMDVAQSKFETPHRSVVLLDAPGHKDFIPNMITGAVQADVAILVIDSTRGEFETGFDAGGQTREHTMLIRSLGVTQVAIAVNKMDNVNWDEERYKEIKSKMSSFLKQVGFKESDVTFVPCSGLTGENLISPPQVPELKKWCCGPTLVDVVDNFQPPERPITKPLRMCVSDVFKGTTGGFCISGKVEAGYIRNGDKVLVMPAGEQAAVKGITVDEQPIQHCFAGDHVVVQLAGVDMNNISTGSMICDIEKPVKVTSVFEARLVIFNISVPITRGFPVILHYQSMSEQAIIKRLISQLNRSTGEIVKKKPRCLTKNTSAVVEIEVNRPMCLELFKEFKDLGRFMLRYGGSTIAAGLITVLK